MEIGNFVSNIQEKVSSAVDAANQAVAESAKAQGPGAIKAIQDSFDGIELRPSSSGFEPVVAPEAEFLDPAAFLRIWLKHLRCLNHLPG